MDQLGLGAAGQPADQQHRGLLGTLIDMLTELLTHGLPAALDARTLDPRFLQPLLTELRTHAAAEAVENRVREPLDVLDPGADTCALDPAADQLMAKMYRRFRADLLVLQPDAMTLLIIHQWQIDGTRQGTSGEFDRRAHIDQRTAVANQVAAGRHGGQTHGHLSADRTGLRQWAATG